MAGTRFPQQVVLGTTLDKTITALAGGAAPTLAANTADALYVTVSTVTTGGDSIILPTGLPQFAELFIYNNAANTCDVYPPTGGTLNGGATTTGQRGIATKTASRFIVTSTDGLTWIADNTVAAAT